MVCVVCNVRASNKRAYALKVYFICFLNRATNLESMEKTI